MTHQIKDTYEQLGFRDIREDCVVTDSHLVGVLAVSGVSLFEMQENVAKDYILALWKALNLIWLPVQLITHSRPKQFDEHAQEIKYSCAENDFKISFEKNREYFAIKHDQEIKNWTMSDGDLDLLLERAPDRIERSMIDSYGERLDYVVSKYNIKEKRYYLVISSLPVPKWTDEKNEQNNPYMAFGHPDVFEREKAILNANVTKAANFLKESGLSTYRLGYDHLSNLLYDSWNFPESYRHQFNPASTRYLTTPPFLEGKVGRPDSESSAWEKVVDRVMDAVLGAAATKTTVKWDGVPPVPSSQVLQAIKPMYIDDSNVSYARINDQYVFGIHLDWFGSDYLEDLSLWPILTLPYDYDLSLHLIPLDKNVIVEDIQRKLYRIEADTREKTKKKAGWNADLIEEKASSEMTDLMHFKARLEDRTSGMWSGSIDLTFRADSLEEMEKIRAEFDRKAGTNKILYSECTGHHLDAFTSTLPLLRNSIAGYDRPFRRFEKLTQEICHFYPYCPSAVQSKKGAIVGISVQGEGDNQYRNIEFFDLFDRSRIGNSIMAVIGNSGSGKTTFMHGFAKNQNLLGYRTIIMDYLGNYDHWAYDMPDAYNVIRIDQSSEQKVNPCDLILPSRKRITAPESPLAELSDSKIKEKAVNEKLAELSAYFRIFLGEAYGTGERGILDRVAKKIYMDRIRGVSFDTEKDVLIGDVMLSDIVDALVDENDEGTRDTRRSLANSLELYVRWSLSEMFNQPTNIEIDDRNIVFLFRHNKDRRYEEISTLQALLLTKLIVYRSRGNILITDELHKIFRMESSDVQNFFKELIAIIRNFEGGFVGMTQQFRQVVTTQAGQEFLGMAETKLYLSGGNIVADISASESAQNYPEWDKLSDGAKRYLWSKWRGHGILRIRNEQIALEIPNHPDLSMYKRYEAKSDF